MGKELVSEGRHLSWDLRDDKEQAMQRGAGRTVRQRESLGKAQKSEGTWGIRDQSCRDTGEGAVCEVRLGMWAGSRAQTVS